MENKRVHLLVRGYVQGVFFRSGTSDMANRFGLTGWVRNLPDGSVEAVFEGPATLLKKAVQWCSNGPPGAVVKHADEEWSNYTGEFKGFEVRYG